MDTNTSALPKRNRHRLLTIALIALIVVAVASVVATSVIIFNRTTRELREETIVSTARLAAAQIDGDRVNGWLANGKDAEYAKTAKVLEDILHNTPNLQYLYVYRILPDGCHVVFDFATPDVQGSALAI